LRASKLRATEAGAWSFERIEQCVSQTNMTEKAPVSQ
jgi:hypothetical protein